jgi:hypothetical protein
MLAGGQVIDFLGRLPTYSLWRQPKAFYALGKFEGDGTCITLGQPKHAENDALACPQRSSLDSWQHGAVALYCSPSLRPWRDIWVRIMS